jgi:hypothetical protein
MQLLLTDLALHLHETNIQGTYVAAMRTPSEYTTALLTQHLSPRHVTEYSTHTSSWPELYLTGHKGTQQAISEVAEHHLHQRPPLDTILSQFHPPLNLITYLP